MNWDEHPNYLKQKQEIRQREIDRAHLEAQAENIQRDLLALWARNPGWELDVDRWGSGGIVLRHFSNTEHNTFKFDYETTLDQ